MLDCMNPNVIAHAADLVNRFAQARPFRHIVIDDFFEESFCANLLAQFPSFDKADARNENGEKGNKATIEKITGLGPAFVSLDKAIQSAEFLDLIGRITSVSDLRYDPWYFGGGTHENRNGQDLDVHLDFNRHPIEHWHRRS